MAHRVLPALAFALLLGSSAMADEPPKPAAPSWPENLKHRNARYAALGRVDDPEGDAHERLIAHMEMIRVHDHLGDLDQMARARLSDHIPPRVASVFARLDRAQDDAGDARQTIVASLPGERRHAETRRFRDLAGDQHELTIYKREQRHRLDQDDRTFNAVHNERTARRDFLDRRDYMIDPTDGETEAEAERAEETEAERESERDNVRGEQAADRAAERAERDAERETDRSDEETERDLEREAEDAEEDVEDATERSAERAEEAADERQTERQQTRDDEKVTGDN